MILDQWGNKIQAPGVAEPQTSRVAFLGNELLDNYLDGLTPARLANALMAADRGDLIAQHRIFSDMEERDPHLYAEISKRRSAPTTLSWRIEPPRGASAKEKADAEWVSEMLLEGVDPLEDLILAMMDAVGQGFAPVEIEWRREDGYLLPGFFPRPQEWFQLDTHRREIRLRDMTVDGAVLDPFGWVFHTHGKAKTGYQARMGLHRVCSWPFIYKAYSLGDFAEYLDIYGLPMIVGKYAPGSGDEEKSSLMRAVTALGHNARAIMPSEMQLDINKISASGDGAPHLSMMSWADAAQSKAILGQVLSAEAKATGMGSGVADLQGEVRKDILRADARQISGTITRDVVYPLLALNRGVESLKRCAQFIIETPDLADFKTLSEGLPKLVAVGVNSIPVSWVHKKLGVPQPVDNEPVLSVAPAAPAAPANPSAAAALAAEIPPQPKPWPVNAANQLATEAQPAIDAWLAQIVAMLEKAASLEEFAQMLIEAYPQLSSSELTDAVTQALAAANLSGRQAVVTENAQ